MAKSSHALPNVSKIVETEGRLISPNKAIYPGDAIDHCKFGDDYAVYNRISGTLLVLNSSAFVIFELMGQGATNSEAARLIASNSAASYDSILDDISAQVSQWQEAGLFDELENTPDSASIPKCHLKANFQSGGNKFEFSSNNQNTFALFCDLLAPLSAGEERSNGDGSPKLSVTVESEKYSVWFDGERLIGPDDFSPARHTAIARIATLAANDGVGCVFHASAFMFQNTTFLVSGRSGAGKSTLTASMAARNAIYLADDLVAMNEPLNALCPNPVRLNVKEKSFKIISKLYPDLHTATDWNVGGVNTRYVQPARLPKFNSCAVDYLIFPKFASQATAGMKRLESRDALVKLATNGIDLSRKPGAVQRLVRFISNTPCYDLKYSSSDQAYDLINQISLPQ